MKVKFVIAVPFPALLDSIKLSHMIHLPHHPKQPNTLAVLLTLTLQLMLAGCSVAFVCASGYCWLY